MKIVEMVVTKSLTAEELNSLSIEAVCRFFGRETEVIEVTDDQIVTDSKSTDDAVSVRWLGF